jgi:hypothetical protein
MTQLQTADVTIHLQPADATLPVMVTPEKTPYSTTELRAWLIENKVNVQQWLNHHGAILLRGFAVESPQQFHDIANVFCDDFSNYVGGNSPRTKVMSHVFTSTEYPKEGRISMHNEASYLKLMPSTILFFCVKPAAKGGQTPLADCRRVLDRVGPELRGRFEQHGVLYVNNMHGGAGLGRSWMDVFGTKDRTVVEKRLTEDGYEFEWRPSGGLRTTMRAAAVLRHPVTQEESWINQAEQWHPSSLEKSFREQLLSIMREDELPHNAFLGDGSPISEQDLRAIREAMAVEERTFHWQRGDVLLCDNYLVMHGRQPYSGDRKILVAMG